MDGVLSGARDVERAVGGTEELATVGALGASLFSLLAVCLLAVLVLWFMARRRRSSPGVMTMDLREVGRLKISQKSILVVVEFGKQKLLLGVGDSGRPALLSREPVVRLNASDTFNVASTNVESDGVVFSDGFRGTLESLSDSTRSQTSVGRGPGRHVSRDAEAVNAGGSR